MICQKCGYNDQKPVGKSLEETTDFKEGEIQFSNNGKLWFFVHRRLCLQGVKTSIINDRDKGRLSVVGMLPEENFAGKE